jgi:guanylate kinase
MIITLTGASGVGKTTIVKQLLSTFPFSLKIISSYTTRKPRNTDIPKEYKHVSRLKFGFLKLVGSFLWTAYPHGNSYGTMKHSVTKALQDRNNYYVLILTGDAIRQLRDFAEQIGCSDNVISFYVLSPSQEILIERLKIRGDEQKEIEKRIADCVKWDTKAQASGIPYEFVNNNRSIESAIEEVTKRFLTKFNDYHGYC